MDKPVLSDAALTAEYAAIVEWVADDDNSPTFYHDSGAECCAACGVSTHEIQADPFPHMSNCIVVRARAAVAARKRMQAGS